MVQKVIVNLVDDIDGTRADETVKFSIDGLSFEIDLASDNAAKLRADVMAWATAGRPAAETAGRRRPRGLGVHPYMDRVQGNAVRDWARRNAYEVADRGRLPLHVVEAFEAASQESQVG